MKAKTVTILLTFSILSIAWINPKADKIKADGRLYNYFRPVLKDVVMAPASYNVLLILEMNSGG